MKMKLGIVRFAVLWIWVITIFVTITVFLYKGAKVKMEMDEVVGNLSSILAIIIPQVTVIFSFFFKDSGNVQNAQIDKNPVLASLAFILSLLYHISFWVLLYLGIIDERFGDTMNANTITVLHIIGFISILGLSPIGFLFSSKVTETQQ